MPKKLRDITSLPQQVRGGTIEVRQPEGEGKPTYEVAVSSEAEVERWWGIEILSHDKGAIDMTRMKAGAAVLIDHTSDQVGVVDGARLSADKVLRADLRFSQSVRGQEIERDVQDGIRRNISVGYFIKKAQLVEVRDGVEVWRILKWQPVEVSIVAVPADATVGVGRSEGTGGEMPFEVEGSPKEERQMPKKKVRDEKGVLIEVDESDARPAVEETRSVVVEDNVQQRADAVEIVSICDANGMSSKASDFLKRKLTPGQVAMEILASKRANGTNVVPAETLDMPHKDLKRYRYTRAISGLVAMAEGREFNGLEAEVHAELAKLAPTEGRRGGVLVPLSLRGPDEPARRTLDAKTVTKGTEVVFEERGDLIELLRNYTAVVRRGARLLAGLTSPVTFPKQTGAATAYWVGENPPAEVSDSDLALTLAMLAPKTLMASTSYSRQLLVQSSIDVESLVRDDLAMVHSLAIDRAALHGLAAAGEPTGVYKAVGVSATAVGGAMTYAKALSMQGTVAVANALLGTLGWIFHPTMATNLRGVLDFPAAAAGRPVWTGTYLDGEVAGYPATATNQMSNLMTGSEATGGAEIGCVFGNWNDLIIGSFSGMELTVDPYRLKKRGIIEVTSFQMADILSRHGESFAKATGATG